MTKHIALYGREGVGKTTLAENISAALMESGFTVEFTRCDLDEVKGVGCDELDRSYLAQIDLDYVIYTVSGDSWNAALQTLITQDVCRHFLVTTADFTALQAVNDALGYLEQYNTNNSAPILFGGLILNCIANSFEEAFVNDFAGHTNVRTIGKVPRSQVVRQCELCGKTVMESQPESNLSYYYRHLANRMVDNFETIDCCSLPLPMSAERLKAWSLKWADQIYALENGLVSDGAAI